MKTKNLTATIVAACLAIALTACGGGSAGGIYIGISPPVDSPSNPIPTDPTNPTPTALSIATQPENLSVGLGQTATFSVVANGNPTPTYQWRKFGEDIPGATASTYKID